MTDDMVDVRITVDAIAGISSGIYALIEAHGTFQVLAVAQAILTRAEAIATAEAVDAMIELSTAVEDHMGRMRR